MKLLSVLSESSLEKHLNGGVFRESKVVDINTDISDKIDYLENDSLREHLQVSGSTSSLAFKKHREDRLKNRRNIKHFVDRKRESSQHSRWSSISYGTSGNLKVIGTGAPLKIEVKS
jgi:hypothetical protein